MRAVSVGSSVVEQMAFPLSDGGSIPTPTLQSLRVAECPLLEVQDIIEREHYSHSTFGVTADYCFRVMVGRDLVGGAIFGLPAGTGVAEKYADGGVLTELRRFVLSSVCPKNSASRSIAVMLRFLRRRGVDRVLSYADPVHGHCGTIYKAAGFAYLGLTAKRKHILWNGKKYPDRNVHQVNFPYHLELRAALRDGTATRYEIPGKHIFVKDLCSTPHQEANPK